MHTMPEFEDMYSFIEYIAHMKEQAERIENILPEQLGEACTIMSYG